VTLWPAACRPFPQFQKGDYQLINIELQVHAVEAVSAFTTTSCNMCKSSLLAALLLLALTAQAESRSAVQFGHDIPAAAQAKVLKHLMSVVSTVYNTTEPGFVCKGFSLCLVRALGAS